jgi:pimeloyl-ACP methyl ester carboxylesterase
MLLPNLLFACTGLTLCSAAAVAKSSSSVLLPKPTGFYQVGRSTAELIDRSRTQPFAPDVEPVKLMVSVFYPVVPQHPTISGAYMLPETAHFEDGELSGEGLKAPSGTFERVALNLASDKAYQNLSHQPACDYPLAIFMPAEQTTRLFYNQIVSTVASNGYIVVTIDAPYDVDVVEYPDGSLMYISPIWGTSNLTALQQPASLAIETRVQDVSFVLDQLSNTTLAHSLVPNLPPSGLNTTHTAMFGHSFGGATAFSILEQDARVLGGLDMDGGLFGPGSENGTSKPFMIMGHADHIRNISGDVSQASWAAAWPNIKGWKRDIIVAETQHYDFSDYPVLFESLDIRPGLKVASNPNGIDIGTLEGKRALQIVTSYVTAFLDFVIFGKCSALLEGPVSGFPEVTFQY